MSTIPANVILIWSGTNATIPAGWERVTSLDSKYPKATADSVAPNVTGGTATHSHTSPTHTHTMISHNHTGGTDNYDDERAGCDGNNDVLTTDAHSHTYDISGVSGGSLSDAVTYASTASDPPYYKVIFIKPTTTANLPTGGIGLWNSATVPTGFAECNGGGTTPDLRNKYLKGADASGDAGGTGGTLTHEHAINHTHTGVTHTHSGESNYANADYESSSSTASCTHSHTHTIYLSANTSAETGSTYTGNAGSADTVEPAYKKLMAVQRTTGTTTPYGIIGMWLGALNAIPTNWKLCDGTNGTPDMRDKWLKIANDSSELGNTGGSNTHTHTASNSHTHTASGVHTHPTGSTTSMAYGSGSGGFGSNGISRTHDHEVTSVSNNTSSWNNATTEANSSNGEPPFRTVAYIQYQFSAGIILAWSGTQASIPAGWEREVALDDYYPKAWGVGTPNTTGGTNTHSHTATTHAHTMIAHGHTASLSAETAGAIDNENGSGTIVDQHTHTATVTTVSGGGLITTVVNWTSVNHEPPYYEVIFIKPTGTLTSIPAGAICHYNGGSVPSGWYYCNGSNSTPDLRSKYLKGATTDADAGGTGGATTHSHTVTHGHTANSHTHSSNCNASTGDTRSHAGGQACSTDSHVHVVNLASTTDTVSDYSNTTAGSGDTVEPAYKKSGLIMNSTGDLVGGMIAWWIGDLVAVPTGWVVSDGTNGTVDMTDKFIKAGTSLTQVGDTGGANTHTHTAVTHTHVATGTHTHTGSSVASSDTLGKNGGAGRGTSKPEHTHTVTSVQNVTATYNNADLDSGSAVDNQPAYKVTAYISLQGLISVSESRSPSATPSVSVSLSPSASQSPSSSESVSESRSPSLSESRSESRSMSASPSLSPSVSESLSESRSPSATPSSSESRSESRSPSVSGSLSISLSESLTPSASPSLTPSASESRSPSASPSPSSSESRSPSASESRSVSLSESRSPSLTPSSSISLSPSASESSSVSLSPSRSPSSSPSTSISSSPSLTPSASPSLSPSASQSASPSSSVSLSPSSSPSASVSLSPSASISPSPSPAEYDDMYVDVGNTYQAKYREWYT
jgi:hypothetical protein